MPPVRMLSIMFTVNAKDVVQRQRADAGGLPRAAGTFFITGLVPGPRTAALAITLRCSSTAPCHPRGAAGVLQQRDVVGLDVRTLKVPRVPWPRRH